MSYITLVRHGQANSGARNEDDYDKLSPLGHQQAKWLGDWMRSSGDFHTRIGCGTLRRQIETARGLDLFDDAPQDARLNELPYFTLAQCMEDQHGLPIPTEREGFIQHLPRVFEAWQAGEIDNPPEIYADFEARVRDVLDETRAKPGPSLLVTSGGWIAMAMRLTLELSTQAQARIALAIMNTSVHRLHPIGETLSPVLFNTVPHLQSPERLTAQTHI